MNYGYFVNTLINDDKYEHKYVQISLKIYALILVDSNLKKFLDLVTKKEIIETTGQIGTLLGKTLILNQNMKDEEFILTNVAQLLSREEISIQIILNS